MKGYAGKILRVDLSGGKITGEDFPEGLRRDFLGGRGVALKMLWDEVQGVAPLSEGNKMVFSTGPLTGLPVPSSGKMVIASKSPLTGGYGDTNIGSRASEQLRRAGYDVLIVEGKSKSPCYLVIEDERVRILDAGDLWGRNTFEVQDLLEEKHGKNAGILHTGPAGERGVRFASITSEKGRAAGRTGAGAVMGSKNLKAVVLKGSRDIPIFDPGGLETLGKEAYAQIKASENYDFWTRQGTLMVLEWANANSCLPTHNFREGTFPHAKNLDGHTAERMKVATKGCPHCNMQCGLVVKDAQGGDAELDYENVAMLGSNIGISNLGEAAALNRLADEYGLDTISLGSCLGFMMEASEKGLIAERISWGSFEDCQQLIEDIVNHRGPGALISEGVKRASERLGAGSEGWAMQVKGMEISAYDCHASPGMALAYGTSPIGAHHKDAWIIAWEIATDRSSYGKKKVQKLIELQRMRGGLFECMTTCRLPWVEVDFGIEWYPRFLQAATGMDCSQEYIQTLGDRLYALMRAYWVREKGAWDRKMDVTPSRWFEEPLGQGDLRGTKLHRGQYEQMLTWYYEFRGWDHNGVPKKETLERLGLAEVAKGLQ